MRKVVAKGATAENESYDQSLTTDVRDGQGYETCVGNFFSIRVIRGICGSLCLAWSVVERSARRAAHHFRDIHHRLHLILTL